MRATNRRNPATPTTVRGAPRGLATLLATAALAAGGLAAAAPAEAQTFAITDARIHTAAGPVIERGTVVVRDGRIEAVGANVPVPSGARVIDGAGKVVTPGFLDSFTQLGVVEVGAVPGTNDLFSNDDRITAAFKVSFGINPATTLIPIARTGGITRAIVAPRPGASIIAGQGALIHLGGGDLEAMLVRDDIAMFGILDEQAAQRAGGSRGVAMLRLREALQDARDFAANRRAFDTGSRREYALSRLDLEALGPVVRGEMPLALGVDRAADIQQALRLAAEFDLRLILLGAGEGWTVADAIARAGVPVVVNPMENIPGFDALAATLENATRMAGAGVTVVFATFDAHNARNLRQAAGNAVAHGFPYDAAMRAITAAPAALWGIAGSYGTLAPGMDADLVVWSGDPFEPLTALERVFVRGLEITGPTRQDLLLERYRRIGERLPESYRP